MSGSAGAHPDEDLSALLDGELDDEAAASVRSHLGTCRQCAEELDRLSRAREALRLLAPVDPPAGLVERFGARIRRYLRIMAGVAAVGGTVVGGVLWAASPDRAVHPPVDEVGARLPALPTGEPLPPGVQPDGWTAPRELDGMPLASVREVGSMTGATYGTGTQTVMLLEEPGQLVTDDYPVVRATLDGGSGWAYLRNGTEEFTWQAGPMVMTLVGAPAVLAQARAAVPPPPRSRSLLSRARSLCRELVEDLTGGG